MYLSTDELSRHYLSVGFNCYMPLTTKTYARDALKSTDNYIITCTSPRFHRLKPN